MDTTTGNSTFLLLEGSKCLSARGNDCQELHEMELCSGGEEGNLCALSLQAMWKAMQVS